MKRTSVVVSLAFAALMLVGMVGLGFAETASHSHEGAAAMACCGDMDKVDCNSAQHDLNKQKIALISDPSRRTNNAIRVTVPDPSDKPSCQEGEHDLNKQKVVQILDPSRRTNNPIRVTVPDEAQEGRCAHATNVICKAAQAKDLNKQKVVQILDPSRRTNNAIRVAVPDEIQGPCCSEKEAAASGSQGHTHDHS